MKLNLLILGIFIASCKTEFKKETSVSMATKSDESIEIVNYHQLLHFLEKKDDKIHVINFWATWCKPCVKELPVFEKLYAEYGNKNVEVILISLDFPDQIESKLIPFIKKRNLKSKVIVLDDPDQNRWINEIDETWSGSIPATLIYTKEKKSFYEQSFDYTLLSNELQKFIH